MSQEAPRTRVRDSVAPRSLAYDVTGCKSSNGSDAPMAIGRKLKLLYISLVGGPDHTLAFRHSESTINNICPKHRPALVSCSPTR